MTGHDGQADSSPAPKTHAPAAADPALAADAVPVPRWQRLEFGLARASEWLNPILVKEARQALKSKQFLVTFTLLLAFGWGWSLLGVALLSPGVYYAPGGTFMLVGYYLILTAPILIVVPFTAFRSLASEREDGTYELLSITTLNSRQIVTGKLGSAVLQMLVYYSALAPCITFTYLLRGVDIFTICFVLTATFLASIILSAAGLVVATATAARHWQSLLSVVLLIGLLWGTGTWLMIMIQLIVLTGAIPYGTSVFWITTLAVLSFYASFVVLFVQASAAQLSFASDNRSTRIRLVLLAQQVLWIGWMGYVWLNVADGGVLFALCCVGGIYWFLCGSMLSGELAQLSPRVQRSLPQSFLGRTLFTWFNPGSGTGYIFAATNMISLGVCVSVMGMIGESLGFEGATSGMKWLLSSWLIVGYVVAYLGAGRLIVLLFRKVAPVGVASSTLIQVCLALFGALFPLLLQAWMQGYRFLGYSSLQASNWAWTMALAAEGDLTPYPAVPAMVGLTAVIIFLLNLYVTAAEVEQVRMATPQRVLQEEAVV